MKRKLCTVLSFIIIFAVALNLLGLEAHASTLSSEKKGVVIEDITVEVTTNKKDIAAAEKWYGTKVAEDSVLLKTVIHARSYFSTPIYSPLFYLDHYTYTADSNGEKGLCQVNSTDVSSDTTAIKKGQAFTATGYAIVTRPEQLGQYVHASELYFKDTKNASVWIAAVPTESPIFEFSNYQKTFRKLQEAQPQFNIGDIVTFGSYEQDNKTSKKEPIEWIVLDKDGTKILLLSRYCLDSVAFNNRQEDVKWADSSLRKWLNTTFVKTAFSEKAQAMLVPTTIEMNDNPTYGTSGGDETVDLAFLLSIEEAETYFTGDTARQADATAYADAQGAQVYKSGTWWRLRSPGKFDYSAASVYASGKIAYAGDAVSDSGCAIRPAVWVDLAG